MASDADRSRFVQPLPAHPNLQEQQTRAKDLLRAIWRGEASALERLRALHPGPPADDALTLADAQLVIARGHGFETWAAMKRKIETLTVTPVQQFVEALHAQDVARVRALLRVHAEVRAAVNAPVSYFDSRPVMRAAKNLPLLDLLLAHGADINLKSAWWAGGFGILESDVTLEEAAPLIVRGAEVDVFAAAHLGMFDRLRQLVDRDPSLVHARGGDGKTALHDARTVEMASYLVAKGAHVDARCVDHESTPAQYLLRDAPDVVRYLVSLGARVDIFMAIALRDRTLVARCLADDPDALDHRIGEGMFRVRHNGKRPSTADEIGTGRGDIYRWVLGPYVSPVDVARRLGYSDIAEDLLAHASAEQRLLAACASADRPAAERLVASEPGILSRVTAQQQRLIADRAYWNDTAAVALMADLGFDTRATGHNDGDALHWAAFLGNVEMVRILLNHDPAIGVRDASYQGTPLDWCVHGSLFGEKKETGDFAGVLRLLIEAGEAIEPSMLPIGRDDVDQVLRAHLVRARPQA
jgi:hypothetical protein